MPEIIWVLDTSSILELQRQQIQIPRERLPDVLARLTRLVDLDSIVYPDRVVKEVLKYSPLSRAVGLVQVREWTKQNEEKATRFGDDYDALRAVLAVRGVETLPDVDARNLDDADPYVLALAYSLRQQGNDARVLTQDRNNAPDKVALASACGLVGVPQLRIQAFLLHHAIWPET